MYMQGKIRRLLQIVWSSRRRYSKITAATQKKDKNFFISSLLNPDLGKHFADTIMYNKLRQRIGRRRRFIDQNKMLAFKIPNEPGGRINHKTCAGLRSGSLLKR